ncbi:GATA transcription factor 18 [Ziziphus jujuba]|uniref:GATA transcription factor 18 n=2 Tax=Ziziphus jujuba TaxID=326968 RepID=A0A6P4AME8_ZIZJJ|nr:GATA transcription factor 18 [Ziziphus jujuba]KAH7520023.1 hypothetical protein FEM48_Zijuj08G0099700 [Ziziphus jujuba var. spinosa]
MMHRCSSSSHGNSVGPCSCGLFHSQSNSLSMLFSMPNNHKPFDEAAAEMYSFASPSSSVDCTLSLGTPSTRLTEDDEKRMRHDYRRNDSCVPNFCWDLLQNKHNNSAPTSHKNGSRGSNNNTTNNSGSDPLLARRCANCDTTSTPLWRNGPRGPKSLCNACGIRFKKEERRATAAAATSNGAVGSNVVMESSNHMFSHHHNNSWINPQSQNQKMPCYPPSIGNEFRFINGGDDNLESDTGISFLSWRLNVTDRPSLVHDFTR